MKRIFVTAVLIVLSAGLLGCETKQVITLNPDGSGKMQFDSLLLPLATAATQQATAADVSKALTELLAQSKGVEAWADLAAEPAGEGKVHLKGTVYFKDLASLETPRIGFLKLQWAKADGGMVLKALMGEPKPEDAKAKPIDEAQAKEKLAQLRDEFQRNKENMTALVSKLKFELTCILPGKVAEANIFEKTGDGVKVAFDGQKIVAAYTKVMADDKVMLENLQKGLNPLRDGGDSAVVRKEIFGKEGAIQAKVAGEMKPLFDFQAEAAKAKAAMPEMFKKLGVEAPSVPAAAVPGK